MDKQARQYRRARKRMAEVPCDQCWFAIRPLLQVGLRLRCSWDPGEDPVVGRRMTCQQAKKALDTGTPKR
jgi:hypothetical protein